MPATSDNQPETAPAPHSASASEARHIVCQRCGACCRWPGYVRVTPGEISQIADHLGMPAFEFMDQCTRPTPEGGLSLTENPDGACLFLTPDNRCDIHEVKPRQCRTFPGDWRAPGYDHLCQALRQQEPNPPT